MNHAHTEAPQLWFAPPEERPGVETPPAFLLPPDEEARAPEGTPPIVALPPVELPSAPPPAPVAEPTFEDVDDAEQFLRASRHTLWTRAATVAGLAAAVGLFAVGLSRPQQAEATVPVAVETPKEKAAPLRREELPRLPEVRLEAPPLLTREPSPAPVVAEPAEPAPATEAVTRVEKRTALPAPTVTKELAAKSRAAARIRQGGLAFERGQLPAALWFYEQAVALEPENADALFGVALTNVELHRDDVAERALQKALRLAPGHALSNLLAGYLAQVYRDGAAARGYYARYLESEPDGRFAIEVRAVMKNL